MKTINVSKDFAVVVVQNDFVFMKIISDQNKLDMRKQRESDKVVEILKNSIAYN